MASRKQAARKLASRRLHAGVGKSAARGVATGPTVRRTRIPGRASFPGPSTRQVRAGNLRNMAFRQRGNNLIESMHARQVANRRSAKRFYGGMAAGGVGALGIGAWINNSGRAVDPAMGRQTGVYGY